MSRTPCVSRVVQDPSEALVDRDQHAQAIADRLVGRHRAVPQRRQAVDASFQGRLATRRDAVVGPARQRRTCEERRVTRAGMKPPLPIAPCAVLALHDVGMERLVGEHSEEGLRPALR